MQGLSALSELICGQGYASVWSAVSAIATTAAVIVALWIAWRDRKVRKLERLEAEARAATLVSQSLSGIIEIMSHVVAKIKEVNGLMLDIPGNNVLYGVDECRAFIEREAFVHQLPTRHLGSGEYVVSLARKWCAEIDTRIQIQRDPSIRDAIDWRNSEFVCSLGERLHAAAISLRENCWLTKQEYERSKNSLIQRLTKSIHRVMKHTMGLFKLK